MNPEISAWFGRILIQIYTVKNKSDPVRISNFKITLESFLPVKNGMHLNVKEKEFIRPRPDLGCFSGSGQDQDPLFPQGSVLDLSFFFSSRGSDPDSINHSLTFFCSSSKITDIELCATKMFLR